MHTTLENVHKKLVISPARERRTHDERLRSRRRFERVRTCNSRFRNEDWSRISVQFRRKSWVQSSLGEKLSFYPDAAHPDTLQRVDLLLGHQGRQEPRTLETFLEM